MLAIRATLPKEGPPQGWSLPRSYPKRLSSCSLMSSILLTPTGKISAMASFRFDGAWTALEPHRAVLGFHEEGFPSQHIPPPMKYNKRYRASMNPSTP